MKRTAKRINLVYKTVLFLFVVFIFVSSHVSIAAAQEKKIPIKGKSNVIKKGKTGNTSVIPFDINAKKLAPNYKGTNIIKLFAILSQKAPLEKKEFETTVEYEKKVAFAVNNNVYAFKLGSMFFSFLDGLRIYPFDADNEKIKIDVETKPLNIGRFEEIIDRRASIIIEEIEGSSKKYIGSNAFGATALVERFRGAWYGLAFVNESDFGTSRSDSFPGDRVISIEIAIPLDKAKSLKNNLGVLLLCSPSLYKSDVEETFTSATKKGNGLIFEDHYYAGATMDSPTSLSYTRKFINVEVLEIWVYELNTGKVILKKPLKVADEVE